jgi:hypothetical protein
VTPANKARQSGRKMNMAQPPGHVLPNWHVGKGEPLTLPKPFHNSSKSLFFFMRQQSRPLKLACPRTAQKYKGKIDVHNCFSMHAEAARD